MSKRQGNSGRKKKSVGGKSTSTRKKKSIGIDSTNKPTSTKVKLPKNPKDPSKAKKTTVNRRRRKKRKVSDYQRLYKKFMGYVNKRHIQTDVKGGFRRLFVYAWNRLKSEGFLSNPEIDIFEEFDDWFNEFFLIFNTDGVYRIKDKRGRVRYYRERFLRVRDVSKDDLRGDLLLDFLRSNDVSIVWWELRNTLLYSLNDNAQRGNRLFIPSQDYFRVTDMSGSTYYLDLNEMFELYRSMASEDKASDSKGRGGGLAFDGDYPTFNVLTVLPNPHEKDSYFIDIDLLHYSLSPDYVSIILRDKGFDDKDKDKERDGKDDGKDEAKDKDKPKSIGDIIKDSGSSQGIELELERERTKQKELDVSIAKEKTRQDALDALRSGLIDLETFKMLIG